MRYYVWLPVAVSLFLMGLYFSGSALLQGLIVPDIQQVDPYSRREFGLLEMLQNAVLAAIIAYGLHGMCMARGLARAVLCGIVVVTFFILLEEIDYGAHVTDLFRSNGLSADTDWDRNLHNRTLADGNQVSHYLKLAANIAVGLGFLLAPLLVRAHHNRWVRWLVPSRWIVATVVVMVLLARLAHGLDDAGWGVVDGQNGYLSSNISEFRELVFYYMLLLYVAGLHAGLPGLSSTRPGAVPVAMKGSAESQPGGG